MRTRLARVAALGPRRPARREHSSRLADCASTPYDCAVAQVQRQEFAAAIRTLERLVARTPSDLKALNLLGIALTGAGKPDEANARFRAALAIDPRFAPALRNLAVNEFRTGRTDAARRHFEEVLRQSPDDEIAHLHLGEIHFQGKAATEALPTTRRAARASCRIRPSMLHYATCLLEQRRTPEAVAVLDRLPPTTPRSWFEAGVVLGRYGAHAEAARFFGEARANGYKDVYAAGYNQTLMLIEAGDNEAAIGVAEELFAQGLKPAELYNLVARAYAKPHASRRRTTRCARPRGSSPTVAEHYIDLAMLCLEHENYDLGLEIVDVGLKHRPDSSMLYLQRGVVLAMKGAIEQAEQEFSRASRACAGRPGAVRRAGDGLDAARTDAESRRRSARADARGHNPTARRPFSSTRSASRSCDPARRPTTRRAARRSTRSARPFGLQPALAQAQAELGKLLLKRGDVAEAIAHLERAIALEPQNAAPGVRPRAGLPSRRADGSRPRASRARQPAERAGARRRSRHRPQAHDVPHRARRRRARLESPPGAFRPPAPTLRPACAAAGDLDGAIVRLRAARRRDPGRRRGAAISSPSRSGIAISARRAGGRKTDLDEAISALTPAVERSQTERSSIFVLGQLLAEQQRFPPAIDHLRTRRDCSLQTIPSTRTTSGSRSDCMAISTPPTRSFAQRSRRIPTTRSRGVRSGSCCARRATRRRGDRAAARRRRAARRPAGPSPAWRRAAEAWATPRAPSRSCAKPSASIRRSRKRASCWRRRSPRGTEGRSDATAGRSAAPQRREGRLRPHARAARLIRRARRERRSRGCGRAASRGGGARPDFADAHYELGLALSEVDGLARGSGDRVSPGHRARSRPRARLRGRWRGCSSSAAIRQRPAPRDPRGDARPLLLIARSSDVPAGRCRRNCVRRSPLCRFPPKTELRGRSHSP